MDKKLKISLYLFLFGLISLVVVLTRPVPHPTYNSSQVLGENTNLTLIIEPDDGRTPLLNRINNSTLVLTQVYLLSDPEIITALASKSARIILEEHPFGGNGLNQKTKILLGNLINWSNPAFALTHEKTMIFDNREVCILNMNLTKSAFTTNREYNICSVNKLDVAEATNIFNADWNRAGYVPLNPNLVVSPENSRGKITALINSATQTLDIEMEVVTDPKIVELLKTKTIPIRLIVPEEKKVKNPNIANVYTRRLKSPYPHAKLIIADGQRAYVGSINLTTQSMDQNRELGILVSQPNILQRLNETFAKDWESANL